jgi:CHAT domain-containing protein/Tfp pilus assembly protein PilF
LAILCLGMSGCRSSARAAQRNLDEAWLRTNQGELRSALNEVDAELLVFRDQEDPWYWRFTVLKAEILVRQRAHKDALALLTPELPVSLQTTDIAIWRKMTQGTARSFLLQFRDSEQLLAESETLARKSHPELLGEVFLRQGTLAFQRGDWPAAEIAYRNALAESLSNHNGFLEAAARGSLGLIASRREHYDESIEWNHGALELSKSLGAQTSVARILGNLGWDYFELGNYEESLALFKQAEESFARTGATGSEIKWLINVGIADSNLGNDARAEEEIKTALQLAETISDKVLIADSLNSLSFISLAKGQVKEASEFSVLALENAQAAGDHDSELATHLDAGRVQLAQRNFDVAERFFKDVTTDSRVQSALRWEAEAQLGKTYDESGKTAQAEAEYRRAIETIQNARRSVGQDELRLTFLSSAIDFYDDYVDFLMRHGRPEDALRVVDMTRSQTLAEGLVSDKGSSAASASGTPPRSMNIAPMETSRKLQAPLLLYWMGHDNSYLWVVTPTTIRHFQLPKESEIEPVVKRYQQALLDGQDVLAAENPDGRRLYDILVAPAQKLIPPDSRVVVLPAESLYGLNFETLIVPGPQPHFWIEDATISTASSLGLLAASAGHANTSGKSLLLVGDAVPASADFPKLAQAPAEMQKVAGHFPREQETLLDGNAATPSAYLKSDPGKFSYLHFVTHGTASHTRPLESAVILSKEGDSYKLYARDIVQHPLSAELVTISACNGAGTRSYAGEGLVGLSWAFLRAGAHNVIGALWEVSDASSTPRLMDALYAGLDRGEEPAVALRDAKLGILHASDSGVLRKPFYWAPFQLYTGMGGGSEKARPVKSAAAAGR